MKNKFFVFCLIAILTISVLGTSCAQKPASLDVVKSVQSMAMFQTAKFSAHYRVPNIDQIDTLLEEQAIPLSNPLMKTQAEDAFMSEWAKRNPTTPNPDKLRALLDRERYGEVTLMSAQGATAATPQIMSLAVPVEFPNSDTFTWCGDAGYHHRTPA